MFQSELYFVRPPRRPGRRRTEPAGQFHQIIWFIGKINWVLQKLYSSTQHRGWLAAVKEIHILLSHSLPNLNPRPLIFSFVVAEAFIIIIWFLTSIYLGGCSEAKLWLMFNVLLRFMLESWLEFFTKTRLAYYLFIYKNSFIRYWKSISILWHKHFMSQPVIAKIGAKVKGSLNASSSSRQPTQPHTLSHDHW